MVLGITTRYNWNIDIAVTNIFYRNGSFYMAKSLFGKIIYEGAYYLTTFIIIILAIILILNLTKNIEVFHINRKAVIFLIVVFIMAPGIVVNTILKENVGRPRPENTTIYGGTETFLPPFVVSDEKGGTSFVSGHASFAFTFMVFGLFFRGIKRKIIFSAGFIFGSLAGFVRIFQGRHFFTDVLFAFFFTWLTVTLIYEFFYPDDDLPDTVHKNS